MQTIRPEFLEWLMAHELGRLACLCKFTFAKISIDTYSLNFVNPWKHVKIQNWHQFKQLMKLKNALEIKWPIKVSEMTQKYLEMTPRIDWYNLKIDQNLQLVPQWRNYKSKRFENVWFIGQVDE